MNAATLPKRPRAERERDAVWLDQRNEARVRASSMTAIVSYSPLCLLLLILTAF